MKLLIFQIAVALLTSLLCGWLAKRLGQARVIGEMVGGILIGPSVFGRVAPGAFGWVFPASSLGPFEALSTVGLILFLFLIGSEVNYAHLRREKGTAALASVGSIGLPFGLAIWVAPMLWERFGVAGVGRVPFTLFLGIAMSITAFPVLARILEERRMQGTRLGTTAILCAAVDDVSAWLLLAVAMSMIAPAGDVPPQAHRFLWLGVYLAVMFVGVRPLGRWVARRWEGKELSYEMLGAMIALVLASAAATDGIGVHPLFGAFLAGLCFPRVKSWQEGLRARLDTVVSLVLLPLFFVLTGLRTRLDLLGEGGVWVWTGMVLLIAVVGKMGGAIAAARWTGHEWRDSIALGALLNTRGLVELVVLNIAYDAGVFSATLFTMMVVMALVTTMMTVPLLNLLGVGEGRGSERVALSRVA